jgi:hypothetical protein
MTRRVLLGLRPKRAKNQGITGSAVSSENSVNSRREYGGSNETPIDDQTLYKGISRRREALAPSLSTAPGDLPTDEDLTEKKHLGGKRCE